MAKPIVSVVGNQGNYQSLSPVASKILWSGSAFTAPSNEQLKAGSTPPMPITGASNAPYVHSFLNKAANSGAQFRVALTNYLYGLGQIVDCRDVREKPRVSSNVA